MTFLSIAPFLVAFIVIMKIIFTVRLNRNRYYEYLNYNKTKNEYQKMNLKVLIETCKAIGNEKFQWTCHGEHMVNLLWYRVTNPESFFKKHTDYLIDIPWFSCFLFKRWENRYSKRKKESVQEIARCKNSTNAVLADIQKSLETSIQKNCEQMKDAAMQQEQILSRLSEQGQV